MKMIYPTDNRSDIAIILNEIIENVIGTQQNELFDLSQRNEVRDEILTSEGSTQTQEVDLVTVDNLHQVPNAEKTDLNIEDTLYENDLQEHSDFKQSTETTQSLEDTIEKAICKYEDNCKTIRDAQTQTEFFQFSRSLIDQGEPEKKIMKYENAVLMDRRVNHMATTDQVVPIPERNSDLTFTTSCGVVTPSVQLLPVARRLGLPRRARKQ